MAARLLIGVWLCHGLAQGNGLRLPRLFSSRNIHGLALAGPVLGSHLWLRCLVRCHALGGSFRLHFPVRRLLWLKLRPDGLFLYSRRRFLYRLGCRLFL